MSNSKKYYSGIISLIFTIPIQVAALVIISGILALAANDIDSSPFEKFEEYRKESVHFESQSGIGTKRESYRFEYISSWLWTKVEHIVVDGDYAYCVFSNGLVVLDISNPASPAKVSEVYLRGYSRRLLKKDNLIYYTASSEGIYLLDVSNPYSPYILNHYDSWGYTNFWADDIFIRDSLAYMSSGYIINISDPLNIDTVGHENDAYGSNGIYLTDTIACYANRDYGFFTASIADPTNPDSLGNYDENILGQGMGVWARNSLAYFAYGYSGGFIVLDISDPTIPTEIGYYDTPDYPYHVFLEDSLAYVADRTTLQIISISDSTNPYLVGEYYTPGWARSTFVSDELAYVADYEFGMEIIDVSEPDNPNFVGNYETPGYCWDIVLKDTLLYSVGSHSGLHISNISDISNPQQIGQFNTPGHAYDVYITDSLAFVADGIGLQIIDISDPTNPLDVGYCNTPNDAHGVCVVDTIAYVADYDSGMQIINVSDPTNPYILSNYSTSCPVWDVTVVDSIAYLGDWDCGVIIVNVKNPVLPTFLGSYDTPGHASRIMIEDSLAYIADHESGMTILNISDPANPIYISDYYSRYTHDICIQNEKVFLAHSGGVDAVNLKDVTSPFLICSFDTQGQGMGISVRDSLVYLADDFSIQILKTNFSDYDGPVWHVSTSGNDIEGDGSASDPFATIQYALNWAGAGDTVQVLNGNYYELPISMKSGVCLRGESENPGDVIITGNGWESSISCYGIFNASIEGLTINWGYSWSGGGGLLCDSSSITVNNCVFKYNACDVSGAGVCLTNIGSAIFSNCIFTGNSSFGTGGGLSCGPDFDLTINNCTFCSNNATQGSGIAISGEASGSVAINNCIIAFNDGGGGIYVDCDTAGGNCPSINCTDIYGNEGGDWVGDGISEQLGINGNISVDPYFCDIISGDYSLAANSPCLPQYNPCSTLIGAYGQGCDIYFICGDTDGDSLINIFDITFLIAYLYLEGPAPVPMESADVNNDGSINIFDITYLISFLYLEGPAPNCP